MRTVAASFILHWYPVKTPTIRCQQEFNTIDSASESARKLKAEGAHGIRCEFRKIIRKEIPLKHK